MCTDEFYRFDKADRAHFIAILQQRREILLRIARKAVLNSERKLIRDDRDVTHIYSIQVEV